MRQSQFKGISSLCMYLQSGRCVDCLALWQSLELRMLTNELEAVEQPKSQETKRNPQFLIPPPQDNTKSIQPSVPNHYYKPEPLKYSKEEENQINSLCKTKPTPVPAFRPDLSSPSA